MKSGVCLLTLSVALFSCGRLLATDNWPQWRGPQATGLAPSGTYPTAISDNSIAWKVELPGRGCSTPAVWGDQIFLTCAIDDKDGVICYNFDGEEQWRSQFGPQRPGKHKNGSGSNPSPTTDGAHLVVYYKSGTLACLDLAGKVLWRTNLQERYGEDTLWWDLGTSPVLVDDRVIVAVMNDGDGFLVALDLADGSEAWKQSRLYDVPRECDNAYTTPALYTDQNQKVIVTAGADHVTGHDVRSGRLVWECGGLNPDNQGAQRMIASPVLGRNVAIVPYLRGDMVMAVRLDGRGDITSFGRLWERPVQGGDVPTPLVRDNRTIVLGDRGQLTCLDVETGDELWRDSLPRSRAKFYSSPVLADDLLYCLRDDGMLYVARVDDGIDLLDEHNFDEQCVATPIPLRDQLLVRGSEHLFLVR